MSGTRLPISSMRNPHCPARTASPQQNRQAEIRAAWKGSVRERAELLQDAEVIADLPALVDPPVDKTLGKRHPGQPGRQAPPLQGRILLAKSSSLVPTCTTMLSPSATPKCSPNVMGVGCAEHAPKPRGCLPSREGDQGASAWFTMSGVHNSSRPAKSPPRFPSSPNLYDGLVVRSVQVEVCALSSPARQCLQVESLRYGVARGAFAQVRSDSAVRIREVPQAETAWTSRSRGCERTGGGEALSAPHDRRQYL